MPRMDVLRPVDDPVRREAKTLIRRARLGALATIDPVTGFPMASRVSVATDPAGCPIFLISQLSGHFGALEKDHRASILLGEAGKGDPLAHPRLTVFGRARRLEQDARGVSRARFLSRHPKAALYADFGDFAFWQLAVEGASYNGGFGKAYEMSRDDLTAPVDSDLTEMEAGAVAHMNDDHLEAIGLYAETYGGSGPAAWRLACIDLEGLDLIAGDEVARIWFDPPLNAASELRSRLVDLAKAAREKIAR